MDDKLKRIVALIGLLLIVLLILIGVLYIFKGYTTIQKSKNDYQDHAENFAKENYDLNKIDKMYYFVNEKSYEIILGENADKEKLMIYNPVKNDEKKEAFVYKLDELQSFNQIKDDWTKSCENCKLKKSGPAMVEETPLWEFTYLDAQKDYVLEYI